uniref:Acyltransferase 3 domain-containing protein n=1 Tax=Ascaris lumbricoides TaxID=6252 RepID=A0A9J2Q7I2_ASCLU
MTRLESAAALAACVMRARNPLKLCFTVIDYLMLAEFLSPLMIDQCKLPPNLSMQLTISRLATKKWHAHDGFESKGIGRHSTTMNGGRLSGDVAGSLLISKELEMNLQQARCAIRLRVDGVDGAFALISALTTYLVGMTSPRHFSDFKEPYDVALSSNYPSSSPRLTLARVVANNYTIANLKSPNKASSNPHVERGWRNMLSASDRRIDGKNGKRDDIQCLRGVAIIYVLLFHLFPSVFRKGFLGVDIFLVISGYLITMILSRNTPISLADTGTFFSKRIRRIFPAYYLMIFAVLVVGRIYLISYDQHLLAVDSGWSLAFLSNVHKYLQQKDYFAEVSEFCHSTRCSVHRITATAYTYLQQHRRKIENHNLTLKEICLLCSQAGGRYYEEKFHIPFLAIT